jgi:tetratricopeptide (TPR) repeat protein
MTPLSQNCDPIASQVKAVFFLCCMGLLVFYGTLHSPFHYDDAHAIVENPHIKDLSKFQETVGIQNIFNRSALLFSFAVNQHIGEMEVFGYHLVNILIHILSAILWFFLVKEFLCIEPFKKRSQLTTLPLVCAIIHLANPLNVQAVTYISSRSSLLATFFYLLAFYIFLKILKPVKKEAYKLRSPILILSLLLILFLGIASKEIAASFPLIAIVHLWLATPDEERKSLIPKLVSILFLLLIFLGYRYFDQGSLFSLKSDPTSGNTHRLLYLLSQVKVIVGYYLLKLLAPFNLNFEPDIVLYSNWFHWDWFFSLIILLIAGVVIFRQQSNLIKFGALWFLITLLPTSSFIPLKQLATEHRTYLPGLGFSLILGWIFLNIKNCQGATKVLFLIFVLISSTLTLNRSLEFRSEVSLWKDTSQKSPRKALVHNNLATAYMATDQLREAETALMAALAINPLQIDSHVNLGHIAGREKNWEQAIEKFDIGINLGTQKADTFYYSGFARNNLGRFEEAIPYFKKAISMKPFKADYYFDLGNSYKHLKLFDDALHQFRKTLEIDPNHFKAHNNMGTIFWAIGAMDQAKVSFEKVVSIKPDIPAIHNNLAAIYIRRGNHKKAIVHLKKLISLQPENANAQKLLNFSIGQIR